MTAPEENNVAFWGTEVLWTSPKEKLFNLEEFMEDYLTKGFYQFEGAKVLKYFDPEPVFGKIKTSDKTFKTNDPKERLEGYTPRQRSYLFEVSRLVQDVFMPYMKVTMNFNDMWSRVTPGVHGWHSDHMRAWAGYNASMNLYFDESSEETGGQLQFHPTGSYIPDDSEQIHSVYPKKFDIVILNQTPGFVHRVTPSDQERRVLSFVCAFHDFNPP